MALCAHIRVTQAGSYGVEGGEGKEGGAQEEGGGGGGEGGRTGAGRIHKHGVLARGGREGPQG